MFFHHQCATRVDRPCCVIGCVLQGRGIWVRIQPSTLRRVCGGLTVCARLDVPTYHWISVGRRRRRRGEGPLSPHGRSLATRPKCPHFPPHMLLVERRPAHPLKPPKKEAGEWGCRGPGHPPPPPLPSPHMLHEHSCLPCHTLMRIAPFATHPHSLHAHS
jgi:hypothetical protein